MKTAGRIVVQDDVRPARPDGTCFYCSAALGSEHREGCVIRTRTVVVDVTFRYVKEVPEDWDVGSIEFQMNESSSCADNLADEISSLVTEEDGHCLCGQTIGKFVREATAVDEESLGYKREPS